MRVNQFIPGYVGQAVKVESKFTDYELAIMEGGLSLDKHESALHQAVSIVEAFDKPYEILRWEKGDFGDVDAIARLDDNTFLSIMFNKGVSKDSKEEAWSVEFYRNNSQEVTGEGDSQRVFATVLSAIQTFIKKYTPNRITFSASKEVEQGQNAQSRARLYDSLVQRYARSWGFRAFRADTGNKVIYELNRIKTVAESQEEFNQELMRPGFRWSEEINGITYLVRTQWDNMPEVIAKVNNREVGRATFIDHHTRSGLESVSTYVSPKWQGHGIAKNMYAVVRMLGANIQPSDTQTAMGKDMWDKWKKAGDTKHLTSMNAKMDPQGVAEDAKTTEHYNGIEISMEKEDDEIMVRAMMAGGRELGHVLFVIDGEYLAPQDLEVDERYQGQGIAATMYDYVKSKGYKIRRSGQQTDAGAGFWDKHKPGKNVWEQSVTEGKDFNRCFDQACKLYDRAVSKNLEPKLVQVADFQGDGNGADPRWMKLPQHVWQHYVVIVGDQVLDPTAKQFGDSMPTQYQVSDLDRLWGQQFQIRPRQGVTENESEILDDLEEGWKDWVAGAALGAAALSPQAADAKSTLQQKPAITQQVQGDANYATKLILKPEAKILIQTARAAGMRGKELAQFVAQCAHETANFSSLKELGGRLDFKKYDPKHNPRKAKILGNKQVGDGAKYHGRGYIQLTGRDNYKRAGLALGLPLEEQPYLVERPDIAAKVAVWFWQNQVAPKVSNFNDTAQVTKPINSGLKGLDDRHNKYASIMALMGSKS